MLSIGAMSGGQAGYYLSLSREDYYLEGGEPRGKWFGSAVESLGLPEFVEPSHLYNLFDGLDPEGHRPLVQMQRHAGKQEHRPGWDLTFSAPKAVSVLWSQLPDEERALIQEAHFESVKTALGFLEDKAILTRRGKGGQNLEKAKALIATFEHGTSRAQDPQLHTHALLMNICQREDGTWGSVSSLSVFQAKMAAGALYRTHLAATLSQELGLEILPDGTSFTIGGVSKSVCQHFSQRRADILADIEEFGITSAAGAAKVALETREAKEEVSRSQLFQDWQAAGDEIGFGRRDAVRIVRKGRELEQHPNRAIEDAATRLLADGAHFSEIDLIRRLAEKGQVNGLSGEDVRRISEVILGDSPDVVRLGPDRRGVHYTFQHVLDDENKFFKVCEQMDTNAARMLNPDLVSKVINKANAANPDKKLMEEQEKAVRWLTSQTGDIAIMNGIAGSGKTHTLATAARAWEEAGFNVQGLALSGRAARELSEKADIECTTIAKALYELDKMPMAIRWSDQGKRFYFDFQGCQFELDNKSVLIVDEAGMVNTSHFLQLAEACQEAGAKLVAVGDPRQLQAIEGASPFSEMIDRFGSAVLDEILRQRDAWAKSAVRDFADGRAGDALAKFAQNGLLTLTETQDAARAKLFDAWQKSDADIKDKLILTDRREDAKILNQMAQEARKDELGIAWVTVGESTLYMGDRISITKTSQARGINNGDRGTLVAINPLPGFKTATIKLDSGEKVTVDYDQFPHLALGYASTTHKAQGETVSEAYVLTGSTMQDKHLAYVQGSRAKDKTHFFMTESEAGDELSDLVKRMSKDRQRTTARQEQEKAFGVEKEPTQDLDQRPEQGRGFSR
jgi:conjugative relaxase-like TrwC/TraI family protein